MSFDLLAPHYGWMEKIIAGKQLHNCRTAFLPLARDCETALLAGEGHGRFLAELRRVNPAAKILCVEQSAGMIAAAKLHLARRGISAENVTFLETDIVRFEPPHQFGLVATHFFLDCFNESQLPGVIAKLAAALEPNGFWLISDFQIPKRGWRSARARLVLALAYLFFRITTRLPARQLVSPAPFLTQQGLKLKASKTFNFDLLCAQAWTRPAPR